MVDRPHRPEPVRPTTFVYGVVAFVLLAVFAIQLTRVARLYSANWDEAHHLYDGYRILTERDYRANAEVPPLVKVLAALPLVRLHPAMPAPEGNSRELSAFLEGRTFLFQNGGDRLLIPARLVCTLFPLTLALLVFFTGRSLFGAGAGLMGLLLFTFDPLVLAHGTLISTDVPCACLMFATVMAGLEWARQRHVVWLCLTALLTGLTLVTKFTGVLLLPILLVLVVAEAWRERSRATLWRGLGGWCLVALTGWVTVWAFYGFRYAPAGAGLPISPTLATYAASIHGKGTAGLLLFLARFRVLPEAFLWGLADTKHKEWDYLAYMLGHVYRHGRAGYFPLAFLIKSTLPFLALLALAPIAFRSSGRREKQALLFLLLPVVFYFLVITSSRFDIGARHMMPIYPFLYVLAGVVCWRLSQRGPMWMGVAALLALCQVGTSLRVAPAYMAYGNEAMGGPLAVRRYLSDSNVDWGQQLKTVRAYLDDNHVQDCWFAYFADGAVQPQDYGIQCKRLPTRSGLWWFQLPMDVPPTIRGTVLISESVLEGVESGDGDALNPFEAFRTLKPKTILQDGVYVYEGEFPVPLASAWVSIRRSSELSKAGLPNEALAVMQTAEQTAPGVAPVELALGWALLAVGRKSEAAAHFVAAQHLLQEQRPDLQGAELGPSIENGMRAAAANGPGR